MTDPAHPAPAHGSTTAPPAPAAGRRVLAALERLADTLDPRDFVTTTPNRPPRQTVSSRRLPLTEDVFTGTQSYFWSWARPCLHIGG